MFSKGVLETNARDYNYTLIRINQEWDDEGISDFLESLTPSIFVFRDGNKVEEIFSFFDNSYGLIGYNHTKKFNYFFILF